MIQVIAKARRATRLRITVVAVLASAAVISPGCGEIGDAFHVRKGTAPQNADDQVRFRTVYYFRVFDLCRDVAGNKTSVIPLTDSLYRFRMTGKASTLSRVHFESGVLKRWEIDPFGANVEFDDKAGRFRFVSRKENEARSRRGEAMKEIEELIKLRGRLQRIGRKKGDPVGTPLNASVNKELEDVITNRLKALNAAVATNGSAPEETSVKAICSDARQAQRGFQIMGPEGWRTFDQDERLLMAMSSSGKPLLGAMKQLSGRVLAEQPTSAEMAVELLRERLRVSRLERVLVGLGDGSGVTHGEAMTRLLDAFDGNAGDGQ